MSNLFSGNPPSSPPSFGGGGGDQSGGQDGQKKPFSFSRTPSTQTPASASSAPSAGDNQARPPLFPRRDPVAPAPAVAPKAPLFPRRDPVVPASADAPKVPLFPRRDPVAPASADAPKAPLFPRRDPVAPVSADAPKAPLFPRRDPVAPVAPAPSAFGTRPATPAPSAFGTRPATPAPSAFGARPATPSAFGARPATPSAFGARPATPAPLAFEARPAASTVSPFATTMPGRDSKITDEEFTLIRDFLYQQSGIFIAENRKYLVENRLSSRLRELGLRSFGEYYKYLRYDANRNTEMNKLFESMTTNETSFFRNQPQLDVFRDKVLAKVLDEQRAKGQKKLRIWSAGCSSGEEPYTLAIILHEVLKQEIGSWDIKITANDLSLAMLAAAQRGLYNDYAIRTTPPDILARYFTKEGNLYRLDPKLQQLISFNQINLSEKTQLQKVERSQIVFCRNVIIYFDDDMKKSVINAFYDNLLPGGYLIIGHSESLHNISRAFKPEHHTGSIVYCKQN